MMVPIKVGLPSRAARASRNSQEGWIGWPVSVVSSARGATMPTPWGATTLPQVAPLGAQLLPAGMEAQYATGLDRPVRRIVFGEYM